MKKLKREYIFISVLLVLFLILTMFVVSGKTSILDEKFFNNIIRLENNILTKVLYIITNIGSTLGVIIILILLAVVFMKKKSLSDFKYVVSNVGIGVILMKILKHIIKRVRPSWKWIVQGGFSYPSGHTISGVLLYGTLILLVNKKLNSKYKNYIIAFLFIMIFLISISRIYFGVHYLTDVVASLILGTIILIISNMLMDKEFNCDKNKNK